MGRITRFVAHMPDKDPGYLGVRFDQKITGPQNKLVHSPSSVNDPMKLISRTSNFSPTDISRNPIESSVRYLEQQKYVKRTK